VSFDVDFGVWGSVVSGERYDIPDSVVDDYERGNLDPYTAIGTDGFSVTQTNVIEGEYAVKIETSEASDFGIISEPGDGLDDYPDEEDTLAFIIRDPGEGWPGVLFNAQIDGGEADTFAFLVQDNDDLRLYRYESWSGGTDGRTEITTSSVNVSSNTWYWGEVDMADEEGNIEGRLFELDETEFENENFVDAKGSELGSVSATDENISKTNRGVGTMSRNDGTGTSFDWLVTI